MLPITLLAVSIGAAAAVVAFALLRLIGFFTNLFYYQRFDGSFVSPAGSGLGFAMAFVPIVGALIIGVMARYGSERIRGHGIPEALEAILTRGSRVEPRVALLKPLSAAISIGSGGPFGAEGPIIMTGGAVGSMVAQLFQLTAAERKTLLVAGAAAGMSATFAAPIASVLLAVELLLFELKPRSFVPVSLASATAMLVRTYFLGRGPLFTLPSHSTLYGPSVLASAAVLGLMVGVLAWLMTLSVYLSEDLFNKLPVHWMWWPALGGAIVGLGGLVEPHALGVGYDSIEALLRGGQPAHDVLRLVLVKWGIWAAYLGSGTSGGVLAPLLMIGSALGGLAGRFLAADGAAIWPLVAMGGILGGTMRSPLTGIVFAVELTGDSSTLLPLLVTATVAHGFTVLVMRRSILTEKVARRGFHVTREYEIDPLDVLFVRDVMQTSVVELPASATAADAERLLATKLGEKAPLYPVVEDGCFVGIVTRRALEGWVEPAGNGVASNRAGNGVASNRAGNGAGGDNAALTVADIATRTPVTAYPDETLRDLIQRMADTGRTRLPVVDRDAPRRLVGMVTLTHTLKAKQRHLEEERRRERVLSVRALIPSVLRPRRVTPPQSTNPASEKSYPAR
jgi:CIC family chloride channel protein